MKIKIGNKIYNGEKEMVMIILDDLDKKNIGKMLRDTHCTKYVCYPEDIRLSNNEINAWIDDCREDREDAHTVQLGIHPKNLSMNLLKSKYYSDKFELTERIVALDGEMPNGSKKDKVVIADPSYYTIKKIICSLDGKTGEIGEIVSKNGKIRYKAPCAYETCLAVRPPFKSNKPFRNSYGRFAKKPQNIIDEGEIFVSTNGNIPDQFFVVVDVNNDCKATYIRLDNVETVETGSAIFSFMRTK